MAADPRPYDHVRATADASVSEAIYRVVGVGDPVALLRVADADGTRENTGEVVTVSRSILAEQFTPAENPDSGLSLGDFLPPLREYATAIRYWLPL